MAAFVTKFCKLELCTCIFFTIYVIFIVCLKQDIKCQWFMNRLTLPINFLDDSRFEYTISETNKESDSEMLAVSEPPDVAVSRRELH
jgi:hypothetical protein